MTEAKNGNAVSALLSEVRSAGVFEEGARALMQIGVTPCDAVELAGLSRPQAKALVGELCR